MSGISTGIELYRREEYEKALRIFRRIAKREARDPESHALVRMALHKIGRHFEALDACDEAHILADVAATTHRAGMTPTARIRVRQNDCGPFWIHAGGKNMGSAP